MQPSCNNRKALKLKEQCSKAGKARTGCTERRSAVKLWGCCVKAEIRWARARGDHAEADRLYRGAWPEKWRARELRRLAGLE